MSLGDEPAKLVLMQNAERLLERKKEETRETLDTIQGRVTETLLRYEFPRGGNSHDLEFVESVESLEDVLRDPSNRKLFDEGMGIVIVRYQSTVEERLKVLSSLNEFFMKQNEEEDLLTEAELELEAEFDFDEVIQTVEDAISTAIGATAKLREIESEIAKLFSLQKSYPDTKKGRKQLEQALVKAEDEVKKQSDKLEKTKEDLIDAQSRASQLQQKLTDKTKECERIKKEAASADLQENRKAKQLEMELVDKVKELNQAQEQINELQHRSSQLEYSLNQAREETERLLAAGGNVNSQELIAALKEQLDRQEELAYQSREEIEKQHKADVDQLKSFYEQQIKELKSSQHFVSEDQSRELLHGAASEPPIFYAEESDVASVDGEDNGEEVEVELGRDVGIENDCPLSAEDHQVPGSNSKHEEPSCHEGRHQSASFPAQRGRTGYAIFTPERSKSEGVPPRSQKSSYSLADSGKLWLTKSTQNVVSDSEFKNTLAVGLRSSSCNMTEHAGLQSASPDVSGVNQLAEWSIKELHTTIATLQEQLMATEEKLKVEVSRVKAKSQKRINALKSQLFAARSDWINEKEQFQQCLDALTKDKPEPEGKTHALGEELAQWNDCFQSFSDDESVKRQPDDVFYSSDHVAAIDVDIDETETDSKIEQETECEHQRPSPSSASQMPAAVVQNDSHTSVTIVETIPKSQDNSMIEHLMLSEWMKAYDIVTNFSTGLCQQLRGLDVVNRLRQAGLMTVSKDMPAGAQINQVQDAITEILQQAGLLVVQSYALAETATEEVARLKEDNSSLSKDLARLKENIELETQQHMDDVRSQSVTIGSLQSAVKHLQREVAVLNKQKELERLSNTDGSSFVSQEEDRTPPLFMFTRLNSSRNVESLRKAVRNKKLSRDQYQETVDTMESYVSLPIVRWGSLVKKYCYFKQMKRIEAVMASADNDALLMKVCQRAVQWMKKHLVRLEAEMAVVSSERQRLAWHLTERLNDIEQESGIFLIKPHFSYKPPSSKIVPPCHVIQSNKLGGLSCNSPVSVHAPPPTALEESRKSPVVKQHQAEFNISLATEAATAELASLASNQVVPVEEAFQPTWNGALSVVHDDLQVDHTLITPRILELDVNRVTMGKHNSSSLCDIGSNPYSHLPNSLGLRTVFTVQRQSAGLPHVREVDLHRQVQSLLLHGPSGQQKLPVKQSALPPIRVPPVQVDSDLKQVQDREWAKGEVKRNRNPARHGHEQTLRRNRSHTAPAGSVRSSTGTT